MTFPSDLLPLTVEVWIDGAWVNLSTPSAEEVLGPDYRLPAQTVDITVGQADESSTSQPGNVSVFLWNGDGWLTPGDPRSPWWPWFDLGCPMRVRISRTTVLVGEVSEVIPQFPVGDISDVSDGELTDLASVPLARLGESMVTVTCSGILRRLRQRERPLRSPLTRRTLMPQYVSRVYDYFPMEEGPEATEFRTGLPTERQAIQWDGPINLASDSTLAGSSPLPSVKSGDTASWEARIQGFENEGYIEWVCRIPQAPADESGVVRLMEVKTTGTADRWLVDCGYWLGIPYISLRAFTDGDEILNSRRDNPANLFGDDWVVLRLGLTEAGADIEWSLTWSTITTSVDPVEGFGSTVLAGKSIDRVHRIGMTVNVAPQGGVSFGHVIVHDGIPGGWMIPADVGHPGETALSRMVRLCGEEDVPLEFERDIDVVTTRLGVQRTVTLLASIEEDALADGGILGESRPSLGLRYVSRGARCNRPVALTLDAANNEIAPPFVSPRDDQQIRNDVTVQRAEGAFGRAVDEDSIEQSGLYDERETLSLFRDLDTTNQAWWRLHLGTYKGSRFPQVTIDLAQAPHLRRQVLELEQADRIQIVNLPPQHPIWPGYADLIVYGKRITASPTSLVVTLNCGPAEPWQLLTWQESRTDSRTSTLASPVDADDTSMSVAIADGLWTTDDAEFPFDAVIADSSGNESEVVTVTDITGASSPQTFTVTRNVNLLGRAHPAGSRVHVHERAVIGL